MTNNGYLKRNGIILAIISSTILSTIAISSTIFSLNAQAQSNPQQTQILGPAETAVANIKKDVVDIKMALSTVRISDNPNQKITTHIYQSGFPTEGREGIPITITVTDPNGNINTYSRITDNKGIDITYINVEQLGKYTAEISIDDPNLKPNTFTLTWKAIP